jgi:hypothetical protein
MRRGTGELAPHEPQPNNPESNLGRYDFNSFLSGQAPFCVRAFVLVGCIYDFFSKKLSIKRSTRRSKAAVAKPKGWRRRRSGHAALQFRAW